MRIIPPAQNENQFVYQKELSLQKCNRQSYPLYGLYIVYALIIITACVCLDKCLTPVWNIINYAGKKLQDKIVIV